MDTELKEYLELQFKSLRSEMANKNDLKGMATKDDIRNMATKDDIKAIRAEMATKDDIKAVRAEMAETKEELKRHMGVLYENMQHKLDIAIEGFQSLTERDERLKKEIDETDKKIGQVSLNLSAHKTDKNLHRCAA